jgi:hypothetical protein
MERTWAIWAVVGRHKQAEMEFRCRNDVDLEPRGPKFDNQCGLSQIVTIRASDIWRGRLLKFASLISRIVGARGCSTDRAGKTARLMWFDVPATPRPTAGSRAPSLITCGFFR